MSDKIHTMVAEKSSTPIPAPMAKAPHPSAQLGQEPTEPSTQWESSRMPGHSLSRIGVHYGSALPVQAKLTVGPVNDHYEQEADHVAQRVVEQINTPVAQRQEVPQEEEEKLQSKPLISAIQRQETPEDEDKLQSKSLADSIQRQEMPKEDEEQLQSKSLASVLQRQETPEDEDKLQSKPLADSIQRQETPQDDEEQMQSKPLASALQRQETPEDEDKLQSKALADSIQRQEMPQEDEEQLQSKPIQRRSDGSMAATPQLESDIQQSRGSGQPLSDGTRQSMEGAFGADFSGVRIHTDAQSDQLNHSIQARAFTTGQDIYFRQGEHSPGTRAGQELLAHELTHVVQQEPVLNRKGYDPLHSINQFRHENPQAQVMAKQQQLYSSASTTPVQFRDQSPMVRRCGAGAPAFSPPIGRNTTNLKGLYGDFKVVHGLDKKPTATQFGEYYINITMTPNGYTGESSIGFLQTVRRGTAAGSWSSKAGDPGMSKEREKRTTKEGWRVDRADPGVDKTPLYGMKKDKSGNVVSRGNANTGKYKGADPWMRDTPGVLDPTAMQFVATAIDVSAGTSFGAVLWGFEYDSSKSHYKEQTPELISKGDPMLKGRNEAIEKWNKAVATPGSGIDQAPEINEKLPFPVGDFPEPIGDTRLA